MARLVIYGPGGPGSDVSRGQLERCPRPVTQKILLPTINLLEVCHGRGASIRVTSLSPDRHTMILRNRAQQELITS
jgi:hypothetical protein